MKYKQKMKTMPLLQAMLKYREQGVYPFHTPGHKGGRGMAQLLRDELGAAVAMDVSLMSELDDIHDPRSYINECQKLAAELYGSDACFWAVNGTTQAIHAMLMTALLPGEKILVPRNAHRSVAGALILGGLKAVFIYPEYAETFGINTQVTAANVAAALDKDKEIKAVLLTSPNYYGIAADVKAIAEVCHARDAVLLVDEAHGAHLGFSDKLPPSAMQCGADACAQSTHKLLGAMTQCSMLHVRGARLDVRRAADVMSMLTTTSPNYLLMASLDAAAAQLEADGLQMAEAGLNAARKLRQLCSRFAGVKVLQETDVAPYKLDVTKVTVNVAELGYSGVEVGEMLRSAGIAVELTDAQNVLFLVTYADSNRDYDEALQKIASVLEFVSEHEKTVSKTYGKQWKLPAARSVLELREVFYGAKESVPLALSAGRICAESVSFYPPGTPVLLPGEIISEEIISYCEQMKSLGLPVSGPADGKLEEIRTVLQA